VSGRETSGINEALQSDAWTRVRERSLVVSGMLMTWGYLDNLAGTRAGKRMHRMTALAMGARVFGMLVMSIGAWNAHAGVVAVAQD
jgi:hypothetical protein